MCKEDVLCHVDEVRVVFQPPTADSSTKGQMGKTRLDFRAAPKVLVCFPGLPLSVVIFI